jgi:hypothetical protein
MGLYVDINQKKTGKFITVGIVDKIVIDIILNSFPKCSKSIKKPVIFKISYFWVFLLSLLNLDRMECLVDYIKNFALVNL